MPMDMPPDRTVGGPLKKPSRMQLGGPPVGNGTQPQKMSDSGNPKKAPAKMARVPNPFEAMKKRAMGG